MQARKAKTLFVTTYFRIFPYCSNRHINVGCHRKTWGFRIHAKFLYNTVSRKKKFRLFPGPQTFEKIFHIVSLSQKAGGIQREQRPVRFVSCFAKYFQCNLITLHFCHSPSLRLLVLGSINDDQKTSFFVILFSLHLSPWD